MLLGEDGNFVGFNFGGFCGISSICKNKFPQKNSGYIHSEIKDSVHRFLVLHLWFVMII